MKVVDFIQKSGVFLLIVLVAFVLFHIKSCSSLEQQITSLVSIQKDSLTTYKTKQGQLVSQINAIQLDNQTMKQQVNSIPELQSELNAANIKVKNLTSLSTAYSAIDFQPTIQVKTDTIYSSRDTSINGVAKEIQTKTYNKTFADSNLYYKVKGKLFKDSVTVSVHANDSITIATGDKKQHFWSKPQFDVTVTNSNPYVTIKNLSNYTVVKSAKWYNSTAFKVGAGVIGGMVLKETIFK